MELEQRNPRALKLVAVFWPQALQLRVTREQSRHKLLQFYAKKRWLVGSDFFQSIVQERQCTPEVTTFKMIKGNGNLNEPLEKESRTAIFRAPLRFQNFMHLEKQMVIKQQSSFS